MQRNTVLPIAKSDTFTNISITNHFPECIQTSNHISNYIQNLHKLINSTHPHKSEPNQSTPFFWVKYHHDQYCRIKSPKHNSPQNSTYNYIKFTHTFPHKKKKLKLNFKLEEIKHQTHSKSKGKKKPARITSPVDEAPDELAAPFFDEVRGIFYNNNNYRNKIQYRDFVLQ